MSLKPSAVTPASMLNLRPRGDRGQPQKMMVIDCRTDQHWDKIHEPDVNGVVLRRRPIRAVETFFNQAPDVVFQSHKFKAAHSRLRTELNKWLSAGKDDESLRQKFLVNDIANHVRLLIKQTKSRDYVFRFNEPLPDSFEADKSALKMLITYQGLEIDFRQPKDKDVRSITPYGVALFRGLSYPTAVEWQARLTAEKAFYLTVEPAHRGIRL
ncbi:DUF1826 domain-containing protein [Terasakiella pusilla]|uniref:DUF1826 domain-containing protein n=1 Tax=Terasakiella pusilla TaxID=64973 RepID=UPI003AA9BC46